MFLAFWDEKMLRATAACHFLTSALPKMLPNPHVFSILSRKNASSHSGVPLLNSWTSKSGPKVVCFVHVDLKMFFALHRWTSKSGPRIVFCTFSLRATAACHFSFLLWPHGSAPAALASLLFDPADPQIIGKTQHFATFLTFRTCVSSFFWLSRNCIFFLLTLLLLSAFHLLTLLLCSAFLLSILSEVSLLNFLWSNHDIME